MKVTSCKSSGMEVSPTTYNGCTFQIIDKWDPNQHAKTCDTMFYLSDGTGAYVLDCDHWTFLDFTGVTQSDWAAKENEAGYIKNKPFKVLGNGLSVDENGVLSITVDSSVTSVNGQTGDVEIDGTKIVVSPDDSRSIAEAIKDSGGGTASEADKLSTARDLKVDLTSKLAQSFDGSEDATTIGVTGTLPLANGGTGNTLGHATALTNQPLVDGTDLDTITEGSHYGSSQPFTNFPEGTTGKYFSLEVIRNSANTGYQRYHDMLTNREFIRSRSGNPSTFSEWVEITNQNNSTNAPLTDGTINSAATNPVLKYRILNDVIYISGSIDVVADGQTSGMQVKVGNIPTEYMPKKAVQGVGYIPIKCDYMGEGREKGSVIVVGDSQSSASAQGAVMFYASTEGTEKLTSATWTFFGSYNLI